MSSRLSLFALVLAVGLLTGCDGDPPTDAGMPTLEVGTGEGAFSTFTDGDTLDLVRGCQGLQHVWIAIRTTGLNRRGVIVDLSFVRDRDGAVVSNPFVVRLSLDEQPDGTQVQAGLTLVVPEPDQAIGEPLTLHATVTDQDGIELSSERAVQIDWGDGGCL